MPFKVEVSLWSVAHKKINTNDLFKKKETHLLFALQWYILHRIEKETIEHFFFLHCPVEFSWWRKLFYMVNMDLVAPLFLFRFFCLILGICYQKESSSYMGLCHLRYILGDLV